MPIIDFLRIYYDEYAGGVFGLTKEQYESVNGYSNDYWGWGSEDDDFYARLKTNNYTIERYPLQISKYKMIKHHRQLINESVLLKTDAIC